MRRQPKQSLFEIWSFKLYKVEYAIELNEGKQRRARNPERIAELKRIHRLLVADRNKIYRIREIVRGIKV